MKTAKKTPAEVQVSLEAAVELLEKHIETAASMPVARALAKYRKALIEQLTGDTEAAYDAARATGLHPDWRVREAEDQNG